MTLSALISSGDYIIFTYLFYISLILHISFRQKYFPVHVKYSRNQSFLLSSSSAPFSRPSFPAPSRHWGGGKRDGEGAGVWRRGVSARHRVDPGLFRHRASLPAQYFLQPHWFCVVRRRRTSINARGYRKLNVQVSTAKSLPSFYF